MLGGRWRRPTGTLKVQVPGVGLGAAGKRCGGNARRELQGSGFRANETAERFHADCAYGQNFAARTLAATRSSMGDVNELLSMRTDVSRGGEAVGSFLYPIEKNRVIYRISTLKHTSI